jgi:hypothetical protein
MTIGTRRRHDATIEFADEADVLSESSAAEVTVAQSFRTLGLGDLGTGATRGIVFAFGGGPPTGGAAIVPSHEHAEVADPLRGRS